MSGEPPTIPPATPDGHCVRCPHCWYALGGMPFESVCPECGQTYNAATLRPIPSLPSVGWAYWCVGFPVLLAFSLIVWALIDSSDWGLVLFFWLVLAIFAWIPSRIFAAQFRSSQAAVARRKEVLRAISPSVLVLHYVTMAVVYGPVVVTVAGCGVFFGICVVKARVY